MKHGLLSEGVTEIDDPTGFHDLVSRLETDAAPATEIERALVRRIALYLVRLRRAALFEAEILTQKLNPVRTETIFPDGSDINPLWEGMVGRKVVLDPGLPARLSVSDVEDLQRVQRYETAIENKLYRLLNCLERLQRMRRGDAVPAPVSVDVSVQRDAQDVASFGNT